MLTPRRPPWGPPPAPQPYYAFSIVSYNFQESAAAYIVIKPGVIISRGKFMFLRYVYCLYISKIHILYNFIQCLYNESIGAMFCQIIM